MSFGSYNKHAYLDAVDLWIYGRYTRVADQLIWYRCTRHDNHGHFEGVLRFQTLPNEWINTGRATGV